MRRPTSSSLLLSSLPLLNLLANLVLSQSTGSGTCESVHLFISRGQDEDYPGRIGQLATAACGDLPSCDYEDVQFTTVTGSSYCASVYQGATNGLAQIRAYNQKCPDAILVLGGYSLGAHVMGDVLGGGGGSFYNCVEETVDSQLDPTTAPGNMVAAALLFGDVRHTVPETYNLGTGAADKGEYPRSGAQLASLNRFSDRLQTWCLSTDPICALGDDGLSHETYMTLFAADAGNYIVEKVKAFTPPAGASSSGSASVTPTPTSSATPTTMMTTTSSSSSSTTSSATPTSATPEPESATSTPTTATPTPSSTTTLSSGAKAGIALSVMISVSAIFALLFWLHRRHRRRAFASSSEPGKRGAGAGEKRISSSTSASGSSSSRRHSRVPSTRYRDAEGNAFDGEPPASPSGVAMSDNSSSNSRKPAFMRADTSYSRVAAHERDAEEGVAGGSAAAGTAGAAGLAVPKPKSVVHGHSRDRGSTGTMAPLISTSAASLNGESRRNSGTHSRTHSRTDSGMSGGSGGSGGHYGGQHHRRKSSGASSLGGYGPYAGGGRGGAV